MAQIANVDRTALNGLYAKEASRKGVKLAADKIEAFTDHEEFLATVEEVLKDDKREAWAPNDEILD
jgi:hypothetical protein